MLKLSKLTDYGTVLMTTLAVHQDNSLSAHELADMTHVSLPTASKLLKQLAHAGLVTSQRGVQGGYQLARQASTISMAEVIAALEGPIALTECSAEESHCGIAGHCGVRGNWQLINLAIKRALEDVSLADMTNPLHSPALEASLAPLKQMHLQN